MGSCESKGNQRNIPIRSPEIFTGHNKPVPISIINKAAKSVCKIIIGNESGTGFFMKVSDIENYLITNNHVIKEVINKDIELEIHNNKKVKLNLTGREIYFFPQPRDITMVEIKKEDTFFNDIEFLNYDLSFIRGYNNYKNVEVFTIQYPGGGSAESAPGEIVDINGYEFYHDITTEKGSSGCPIILNTKNENLIGVIGIHKGGEDRANGKILNCGTFIGEIINKDNGYNVNNSNNYIIAEMDIKEKDINQDIRIINSYENFQRLSSEGELMNEEEIKKCEIRINDILIPFNYFYKFKNKGKYNLKYSFNNHLNKTDYMFSFCLSLTNIDLSNFNTQNVTNMKWMFWQCSSLKDINLYNINTHKVKEMSNMFGGCSSLKNINLSNFNTQEVTDMSCMFLGCSSLINIDLSNFNTQNVTDMSGMFSGCSSLTNIDLSNFNTQNVTNMGGMFLGCSSLINIDLSNFNTQNVTNMSWMFSGCSSLINLNLFYFITQNVIDMNYMFLGCLSLKKKNIICKDNKLLLLSELL